MDSDIAPSPKDSTLRKRYSRTFLLKFKEDPAPLNKFARQIIEGLQKGNRSKNKTAYSKTRDNDRYRDQGSIVLGPQKRTWNTGCHVSPTSTQEPDSNYRSNFKADKVNRGNEYKRDNRNGMCMPSRDRTSKRNEATSFKKFSKDDKSLKNTKFHEEEPEWFSAGPTNVSETIELRGIPDDITDITITTEETEEKKKPLLCSSNADKNHENIEEPNPQMMNTPSGDIDPSLNVTSLVESVKSPDGQGSRFKHLFSNSEAVAKDTESINRQLLQLLLGAPKSAPTPAFSRTDVLQVEKKLRSILLGHGDGTDVSSENQNAANKKPHIFTLEEIEAKIIPSEQLHPSHSKSALHEDNNRSTLKAHAPIALNEASNGNLPLVSPHHVIRDRVENSNSSTVRTALNSLRMLASAMPRYSASTNAAVCTGQMQRTDVSVPPLFGNATSMRQGATNHVQVTSLEMLEKMLESHDQGTVPPLRTTPLNHEIQRKSVPNSSANLNQVHTGSMHFGGVPALGRPIVKASHLSAGNHLSPFLASLIAMDDDGERRAYNQKQQHSYSTGHMQMCSGKFVPCNSSLYTSGNNAFDARYNYTTVDSTVTHADGIHNNPIISPSLSSGITSNNTACIPNVLQAVHSLYKPQSSTGSLAFLSHTATAGKVQHLRGFSAQKPSNACGLIFNNLPSAGEQVRPRTLEEIEQFEFLRNETYL